MDSVVTRLIPLFQDVLNNRHVTIDLESNADSIPGYDSLAHIDVISAIEREFDIAFEFSEIVPLETVGDMVALISRKTAVAA